MELKEYSSQNVKKPQKEANIYKVSTLYLALYYSYREYEQRENTLPILKQPTIFLKCTEN